MVSRSVLAVALVIALSAGAASTQTFATAAATDSAAPASFVPVAGAVRSP